MLLFLLASLLFMSNPNLLSQQEKTEEKQTIQEEIDTKIPPRTRTSYNPSGRKDPFRDLLALQETTRKTGSKEGPQLSIENIELIGIVHARGEYTAILTGPQDFPLYVKVGHKFSDGFVLSISDSKVVFRRTQERGVPLYKPRDIVKELKAEEIR